jgi:Dinucleotide-utilizing enzymes involved in molybdopterin and thiamine biosynthesis family 2
MDINDSLVSRFYSQIILEDFSIQDQENLLKKEITIIGCGGLGSPLSVYLAASGIGRINLVDPDKVEIRNLHRQVFFQEEDMENSK